ncbi:MAG: ankyrin repeat domain-containing protein [Akkermansia sp.]|nr:ankyrin repeat domain-containing protein [Akkermansia sp.]
MKLLPVFTAFTLASQLVLADTGETYSIPTELNGKKLHFSYSPAFKMTPLLIDLGKDSKAVNGSYTAEGERGSYTLNYQADIKNKKAKLFVKGKKDTGIIDLKFEGNSVGTAHMKWNNIDYYHLKFRVQDSTATHKTLQRMDDPVGDVVPRTLAGKKVVIDFKGAIEKHFSRENENPTWQPCRATPFVIQFPTSGDSFRIPTGIELGNLPPEIYSDYAVSYELIGTAACIEIRGPVIFIIELDFANSESGIAHVEANFREGYGWEAKGAVFSIIPSNAQTGDVELPDLTPPAEDDTVLKNLIDELSRRQYTTAVEKLYQRRVLSALQSIRDGADVNMIIPNANGTTALHNACGLSYTEIVCWLIEHGADLDVKTAKGATVDDCVGGTNAKSIRMLLKKARSKKK